MGTRNSDGMFSPAAAVALPSPPTANKRWRTSLPDTANRPKPASSSTPNETNKGTLCSRFPRPAAQIAIPTSRKTIPPREAE